MGADMFSDLVLDLAAAGNTKATATARMATIRTRDLLIGIAPSPLDFN
jgi:hypothetical protein